MMAVMCRGVFGDHRGHAGAAREESKRLFSGGVSCIIREEAVATCVAQTRKSLWYGLPFLPSGKNEMVKSAFFTIGET